MTLSQEVGKEKGEKAPLHRFSRPYVVNNTTQEANQHTEREVRKALEADKRKYGAEEQERRVKEKIRRDLEREAELREEEKRKGEEKIRRMEERELKRRNEGKDPYAASTEEEDDGVDNTVLTTLPPPDPRNANFGAPLSTDYRLSEAQKDFEKSGAKRAVIWRSGAPAARDDVSSSGEEE